VVSQVIGEDIALWNSSFFAKPARVGTKTPWHQDGEYWPIRPLATCTVWIAVDVCREFKLGPLKRERCIRDVFDRVIAWSVCHFTTGGQRWLDEKVGRRRLVGRRL
jgi:Phytanoyl-CoA dioxygenase (PhyH)